MNNCVLTGNLGDDPAVAYSSEGNPWANFSLAFRSGKKKTSWIKIVCFNRLAEICQTYLHKGARVAVVGSLDQDKWETEHGEKRTSFKMIANSIEFIKTDGRGFEGNNEPPQDMDDVPF